MKHFLFAILTFVSFNVSADIAPVLQGSIVPAEISVSYYQNLMPDIGPGPSDKRVFIVKATVEFCRTVSSLEFEVRAQAMDLGGYALQLVSTNVLMDCFGPTHKQELTYRLPDGVNGDGPFYTAQPIIVDFLGNVY